MQLSKTMAEEEESIELKSVAMEPNDCPLVRSMLGEDYPGERDMGGREVIVLAMRCVRCYSERIIG